MKWLFTGLAGWISGFFRAIYGSGFFKSIAGTLAAFGTIKIFTLLGLAFVTYEGSQFTLDWAMLAMQEQITTMQTVGEGEWLSAVFMGASTLKLDAVLTNLFTAYSLAFAISTMKTGSNLVSTI